MRAVYRLDELDSAYQRCQSEARASFGNGEVYVEQLMPRARHVEVQIVGDRSGCVSHLWERECTIQRRNQKLVEVAPSPGLGPAMRDRLIGAAIRLAEEVRYDNLGTFEFLVEARPDDGDAGWAFIEANPRLQVEHTVTEEVTGVDLVKLQLQLAGGKSIRELGLLQSEAPPPRGFAMQVRINMESMGSDGATKPSGGTITAFEPRVRRGSAGRFVRLRRLYDQSQFRLDAGQADRTFAVGGVRRCGCEGLSRVVRVQDRGRHD